MIVTQQNSDVSLDITKLVCRIQIVRETESKPENEQKVVFSYGDKNISFIDATVSFLKNTVSFET